VKDLGQFIREIKESITMRRRGNPRTTKASVAEI